MSTLLESIKSYAGPSAERGIFLHVPRPLPLTLLRQFFKIESVYKHTNKPEVNQLRPDRLEGVKKGVCRDARYVTLLYRKQCSPCARLWTCKRITSPRLYKSNNNLSLHHAPPSLPPPSVPSASFPTHTHTRHPQPRRGCRRHANAAARKIRCSPR